VYHQRHALENSNQSLSELASVRSSLSDSSPLVMFWLSSKKEAIGVEERDLLYFEIQNNAHIKGDSLRQASISIRLRDTFFSV